MAPIELLVKSADEKDKTTSKRGAVSELNLGGVSMHKIMVIVTATAAILHAPIVEAASMPAPAGFSTSQLVYEDTFTAPALDATKWNPWLGNDQYGRWGDQGHLSSPYSGANCPNNNCSGAFTNAYNDPYPYGYATSTSGNHLMGGTGTLSLTSQPGGVFSGLGFGWAASAISSYGKMYLPATGGYVQIHAKMPDSRYGAWAGLWMLPQTTAGAEFDIQESGYLQGTTNPNNMLASDYHGPGSSQIIQNTGTDLSQAFHTYGVEYIPGQAWNVYLDGALMGSWTHSVPSVAYEVIINLQMAESSAAGWHTVQNSVNNPGPFSLVVDDVQIYSSAEPTTTTAPSVPTGLTATVVSSTEITLSWNASTEEGNPSIGYDVYRDGNYLGFSATTAYDDGSLAAGSFHTYQVLAYDPSHNMSALSAGVGVTSADLETCEEQ